MAGNGVRTSRDHSVLQTRAFSPSSLAHRSISGAPIFVVPDRCLICSRSAATPCKCSNVTRASIPVSAAFAASVVIIAPVASGVRLREQRLLRGQLFRHRDGTALACRDEARRHELAEQRRGLRGRVPVAVAGHSPHSGVMHRGLDGKLLPVPPSRMSWPGPPISTSSPAPPVRMSSPALPIRTSSPSPPLAVSSMPVRLGGDDHIVAAETVDDDAGRWPRSSRS